MGFWFLQIYIVLTPNWPHKHQINGITVKNVEILAKTHQIELTWDRKASQTVPTTLI